MLVLAEPVMVVIAAEAVLVEVVRVVAAATSVFIVVLLESKSLVEATASATANVLAADG